MEGSLGGKTLTNMERTVRSAAVPQFNKGAGNPKVSSSAFIHLNIQQKKKWDVYLSLIPSLRPLTAAELPRKYSEISGTSTSDHCFKTELEKDSLPCKSV